MTRLFGLAGVSVCLGLAGVSPLPRTRGHPCRHRGNAQKLQWLQLASSNDPFALDNAAICSLCWALLSSEGATSPRPSHYFPLSLAV